MGSRCEILKGGDMDSHFNRRDFLKTVGLGAAALAVTQFEFCGKKAGTQPNVRRKAGRIATTPAS